MPYGFTAYRCRCTVLPTRVCEVQHAVRRFSVQVGPGRLLLGGEAPAEACTRLRAMLTAFPAAPFSYQRLAELLLEPRKQYSQLHKLVGLQALAIAGLHAIFMQVYADWLT